MAAASPLPNKQIVLLIAVFVALTAALTIGYFMFLKRDYAVLYQGMRPAETAAVVAELKRLRIDYKLASGGTQILVPTQDVDDTRVSVASADLPVKGLEGFELFNSSDMGLTDFSQRIKYQRALQGELARTIMMMEGVEEARVHIAIPDRSLFRNEQSRPKAAVTLSSVSTDTAAAARIEGVQKLVAAAIPELDAADVVVLSETGEVISKAATPAIAEAAPEVAQTSLQKELAVIISRVTPDLRFDIVLVEPDTSVETAQQADAGGATLQPLPSETATIQSESTISDTDRHRIIDAIRAAGGDISSLADGLMFETVAPAQPAAIQQAETPATGASTVLTTEDAPAAETQPSMPTLPGIYWSIAAVAAALVLLAVVLLLTRRERPALRVDDHKRFAERLRIGLDAKRDQYEQA
jgi:flagellar M-ring protein FliF